MSLDRRSPRRTLSWRAAAVSAAIAVIGAACGGVDTAGGAGGDADGGAIAAGRAADPANCPLEALDDADGPVDVTLWHGVLGLTAVTLEEFAEDYNDSQGRVRVSVESQGDYDELFTKFSEASRANDFNTLPDVLVGGDIDVRFMADSGAVVAADDCIAADPGAESHYETLAGFVRSTYTVDGVLWPAVFGVSSPVLYYNRAHLDQAGLDPDDPPASLEDLRATAEAIKAVRPEGFPLAFRADPWWLENLATREKDAFVDNDNGRSALARRSELLNDTTVEVVDWLAAMVDDELMTVFGYTQVIDAPLAVARPEADNSSMLIETSAAAPTLAALLGGDLDGDDLGLQGLDGIEPIEVGVGELPGPRSAGSGQVGGNGWYIVDGPNPAKVAAAWDFLRWVTETPQQVKWTTRGGYLPVWQGALDDAELQAYFTDTRAGRWLQVARDSIDAVDPEFPGPVIGPYKEMRMATRTALERILLEGRPIEQELEAADTAFQAALDDYARDVGIG